MSYYDDVNFNGFSGIRFTYKGTAFFVDTITETTHNSFQLQGSFFYPEFTDPLFVLNSQVVGNINSGWQSSELYSNEIPKQQFWRGVHDPVTGSGLSWIGSGAFVPSLTGTTVPPSPLYDPDKTNDSDPEPQPIVPKQNPFYKNKIDW